MAKLTLTDITSGYALTTTVNANNALIEAALENTLSRDGTGPNTMSAALDMNSQNINNLPNATQNQQPVTLAQAASIAGVTNALTRETVGAVFYPTTAGETAASVTPTNFYYEPGDVRRYGAAGDGATDDTTAIQNAVDSGATVFFQPFTTYLVSSTITLASSTVVYGNRAILKGDTGMDVSVISNEDTNAANPDDTDVEIYGLTVDATNMVAGAAGVACISIANVTRGRVSDCTVIEAKNDSIRVGDANSVIVDGNVLRGTQTTYTGIKVEDCFNVVVRDNWIGHHNTCIQLGTNSYNCVIQGNYLICITAAGYGVLAGGSSTKLSIISNTIRTGTSSYATGIQLNSGSDDSIVSGNGMYDVKVGINIQGDRDTVTGNQIFGGGTSTSGLVIAGTNNHAVGNFINNFTTIISTGGSSPSHTITNNTLLNGTTNFSFGHTGTLFGQIDHNTSAAGGDYDTAAVNTTTRKRADINKYHGSQSIPTSGSYRKGDFVWNMNPAEAGSASSKYIVTGWKRLTTGSGHVLNTDWFEMRSLTGN